METIFLKRITEVRKEKLKLEEALKMKVDLVEYDKQYEKAFQFIFGNTLVVKDIDTARRIGIGKIRMVTMTGDLKEPLSPKDSIYIEDGRFAEIGTDRGDADTIVDAKGMLVSPGLIDGHVHPTIGDFTAAQNSTSWVTHYLQL